MTDKQKITEILKAYTKKNNISASSVILEEYAEELLANGVIKVVRCKDCKHWGGVTYGFVCRKFSGIETKICMGADQYCSYGELKRCEGK
jgi:hypothetical protein